MEGNLAELTKQIALHENIQDYKLEIETSNTKGDGYLGMIKFAKIIGSNTTLKVVFKCRHPNQEFLPETIRKIFINEITFYAFVVPTFEDFQREYNVSDPFNNSAKFFGYLEDQFKETLALQDLREDNYFMWDRQRLMDEQHVNCALKTFAKFHSISFAMQQLKPEMYKELAAKFIPNTFNIVYENMGCQQHLLKHFQDIKAIFKEDKDKYYLDHLEKLESKLADKMNDVLNCDKHSVITQGDCWCTNAMYRYETTHNENVAGPVGMKLVDFQMARLGSPMLDVSYFVYASVPKCYFDRLEDFLAFYHDELKRHLLKFGVTNENVYTFEDIMEDWQELAIFGLSMTIMAKKAMLIERQNAPDITEGMDNFFDKLNLSGDSQSFYNQQIRDLVEHFVDRKLF